MSDNIKQATLDSKDYNQFVRWVTDEWGEIDQLATLEQSFNLPLPILSFQNGTLTGGLSFIHFKSPECEEDVLWINTLYVDTPFRRRYAAQHLVSYAEQLARDHDYHMIYVYTVIPDLYKKLGWTEIKNDGESFILKRILE